MEQFLNTMDAVFVEGGVFCPVPLPACGGSLQPVAHGGFITERVRKQMRHRCVFHCGQQPQVVWGECKPAEVKEIHQRVRVAAQVCKERVRAEFKGLRMAWSVLRLARVEAPTKIRPRPRPPSEPFGTLGRGPRGPPGPPAPPDWRGRGNFQARGRLEHTYSRETESMEM